MRPQIAPKDCPRPLNHTIFRYCPDCTWMESDASIPQPREGGALPPEVVTQGGHTLKVSHHRDRVLVTPQPYDEDIGMGFVLNPAHARLLANHLLDHAANAARFAIEQGATS